MYKLNSLEDWSSIVLICACHSDEVKNIDNLKEIAKLGFDIDTSKPRQINFICKDCHNNFDYEIKVRLFDILDKYIKDNGSLDGFNKYISRHNQRIRLKYLKSIYREVDGFKKEFYIIELANLTTHPEFKK